MPRIAQTTAEIEIAVAFHLVWRVKFYSFTKLLLFSPLPQVIQECGLLRWDDLWCGRVRIRKIVIQMRRVLLCIPTSQGFTWIHHSLYPRAISQNFLVNQCTATVSRWYVCSSFTISEDIWIFKKHYRPHTFVYNRESLRSEFGREFELSFQSASDLSRVYNRNISDVVLLPLYADSVIYLLGMRRPWWLCGLFIYHSFDGGRLGK